MKSRITILLALFAILSFSACTGPHQEQVREGHLTGAPTPDSQGLTSSAAPTLSTAPTSSAAGSPPTSTAAAAVSCPSGIVLPSGVDQAMVCAPSVPGMTHLSGFRFPAAMGIGRAMFYGFKSPTGNLACSWLTMGTVVCKAVVLDVPYPHDPANDGNKVTDCERGLYVSDDGSGMACAGDVEPVDLIPDLATVPVLAYGQTAISTDAAAADESGTPPADPVACHSSEDGITCWNTVTRHGIKIARSQAVFW